MAAQKAKLWCFGPAALVLTPHILSSAPWERVCLCVLASLNRLHCASINVVTSEECRQAVCVPLITAWQPNTLKQSSLLPPCPLSSHWYFTAFTTELIYHVCFTPTGINPAKINCRRPSLLFWCVYHGVPKLTRLFTLLFIFFSSILPHYVTFFSP